MKRFLMVLALGGIIISGCGDDDGDDDSPGGDSGTDAGQVDSGVDSGMDARIPDSATPDTGTPVVPKVNNPGTVCTTANAATTCMPASATCAQTIAFGATPPGGGFCTAMCKTAAECGTNGACPFGELFGGSLGPLVQGGFVDAGVPVAAQTVSQQCLQKCTTIGGAGCAAGYVCTSLKALIPNLSAVEGSVASVNQPVCLPATGLGPVDSGMPVGDAGPQDSGVADASGIDSGR